MFINISVSLRVDDESFDFVFFGLSEFFKCLLFLLENYKNISSEKSLKKTHIFR